MADILKSKMVVSGNDIVRFIFILWQFALENVHAVYKCYIELSSLYLKVAKRHENNINFNISLKQNTTTFKFAHVLSRILCDGIRKQSILQTEVFFFKFTNV